MHWFPRFGLDRFMRRQAQVPGDFKLEIGGDVREAIALTPGEIFARRDEATTSLHCVTTWSYVGLRWSGRAFRSVWDDLIVPRAGPRDGVAYLLVTGLDGFSSCIPLEEALHEEAFLADGVDGGQLGEHGAPLRLVLPRLYAYKSVKHVCRIAVTIEPRRGSAGRFLGHARGRVDLEERSGWGMGRLFRALYRLLLPIFLWRARSLGAGQPAEPESRKNRG